MKKWHQIRKTLQQYGYWFIMLLLTDFIFGFLLWLLDSGGFWVLFGMMTTLVILLFLLGMFLTFQREAVKEQALKDYWLQPNDIQESEVIKMLSSAEEEWFRNSLELFNRIQRYQEQQNMQQKDYEDYIEAWVHEIKIPLSLMTLILDNRREEMTLTVYQKLEYARETMQENVDQILYYARLKASHKDYRMEAVSLEEVLRELLSDYQFTLEQEQIQVSIHIEETVFSDRRGLAFLLGQLLSNAVKYQKTDEQNRSLLLETCKNEQTGEIVLNIQDNGVGILESDLPFVMDKGFTGEPQMQKKRSTGMGLYLAKQMAKELNIKVDIKSVYGEGTSVRLSFPFVAI